MKRILVLGDDGADAPWHPLASLEPALRAILSPLGEVEFSREREEAFLRLVPRAEETAEQARRRVDLLVLLQDRWEGLLGDEAVASLLRWVEGGGRILALHQGISLQARPECAALLGAYFVPHPEAAELRFELEGDFARKLGRGRGPGKDVLITAWTHFDEPYRFEFAFPGIEKGERAIGSGDLRIFLRYEDSEGSHPAGWVQGREKGRVLYLAPGHGAGALANPAYAALVGACAGYLLRWKHWASVMIRPRFDVPREGHMLQFEYLSSKGRLNVLYDGKRIDVARSRIKNEYCFRFAIGEGQSRRDGSILLRFFLFHGMIGYRVALGEDLEVAFLHQSGEDSSVLGIAAFLVPLVLGAPLIILLNGLIDVHRAGLGAVAYGLEISALTALASFVGKKLSKKCRDRDQGKMLKAMEDARPPAPKDGELPLGELP